MGVRPPQQNDEETPETIAFGIAVLDEYLERADVIFPMTGEELLDVMDDPTIPYDAKGNEVRLSEALAEVPQTHFENRQAFMNALHPVLEAQREQANNSIIGQLRSLLPF